MRFYKSGYGFFTFCFRILNSGEAVRKFLLAFSNLLTCDADASTPIFAKINDTNTTNEFTFVKSGIRACAHKSTYTGFPIAM